MQFESIAIANPTLRYDFAQSPFEADQPFSVIPLAGGAGIATVISPHDGFIVALTVNLSASISAGALALQPIVNDEPVATPLSIAVGQIAQRALWSVTRAPFRAGDALGVAYTSDAALAPGDVSAFVALYVVLRGARYP